MREKRRVAFSYVHPDEPPLYRTGHIYQHRPSASPCSLYREPLLVQGRCRCPFGEESPFPSFRTGCCTQGSSEPSTAALNHRCFRGTTTREKRGPLSPTKEVECSERSASLVPGS